VIHIALDTARFNARLRQFVHATTREAEQVVFEVAAQVLGDTQAGWPVDSGASRAAWFGPNKSAPLTYQIGNPLRYSPIVEYGGFSGPGPGTEARAGERLSGGIQINPGVYSRKQPSAPLRRALAKNYEEMTKKIKASHQQHWGR